MELFIYSDESGVLDKVHNDYFTYGGLILVGKSLRDQVGRKYIGAEKNISKAYPPEMELKASCIKNKHKTKLFNAVKPCIKFGAVISQAEVRDEIFNHKQSKQRYLDYVYKMALKHAFLEMEKDRVISFEDITVLNVFVDEHTTATDGRYELRQALLQEFKIGTFNWNWNTYYSPIFPNLLDVRLQYCNSAKTPLVRAADIIANRLYFLTSSNSKEDVPGNFYIKRFP